MSEELSLRRNATISDLSNMLFMTGPIDREVVVKFYDDAEKNSFKIEYKEYDNIRLAATKFAVITLAIAETVSALQESLPVMGTYSEVDQLKSEMVTTLQKILRMGELPVGKKGG